MSHRIMPMKATVVATYEGYKSYSEYLSDTSFNGTFKPFNKNINFEYFIRNIFRKFSQQ